MSNNRKVYAAINRAYLAVAYSKYDDIHNRYEFQKHIIKRDNSLIGDEKTEAKKILTKNYDENMILINEGTGRLCEGCNQKCLATSYCENCVRNYLKERFFSWTSRNNDIDNIIKECQMKAQVPSKIAEWIPYDKLKDIKYLTEGGFSEIYTAIWVDGHFIEWDSKKQELKRSGQHNVILKSLEDFESTDQSWFEEAKLHLSISNRWNMFVQCFGLTQDPLNGNYMLVMNKMDMDLRKYLQQNHNLLTWRVRTEIVFYIISALKKIHKDDIIHRDLHSGNILYTTRFSICDLGFSGPADKPLGSVYGNLPYIAPEVIGGKQTTKASDIYSVAMLMWEISSGRPPFVEREHNYNLASDIINGIRPKIVPGTPLEYKDLMEECWNADPLKRPDTYTLWKKIDEIKVKYQNKMDELDESLIRSEINNYNLESYKISTSRVHQFENLPEPRNATEEELEAFHSKPYDFDIPNNIEDFGKSVDQKDNVTKVALDISKKDPSKVFNKLQISSKIDNVRNDYCREETIQQQRENAHINDDDGMHNNSDFHLEEQNELELPDDVDIEENEKKESNENNVDIQNINPSESHSEEELKKDNNIDVEENEKEENDENHVVVENINSSESHSEEEEPKKDNNIDVEENEKEKNDENNVVVENINSSESHSEEQQLKKDEINMNVEENEKEECRKCDDGDSVHSVSEKVILPEIILTHSEDSVVKESNNPNIENIVTVNQVNQVNQINQINQINQYNIIQNVQNVNNVQQPQQPDDYEGSVFLKTVRKLVKEVENIVDKATKARKEAVLRSNLQEELQEVTEEIVE